MWFPGIQIMAVLAHDVLEPRFHKQIPSNYKNEEFKYDNKIHLI